jgi:hypothetical protein
VLIKVKASLLPREGATVADDGAGDAMGGVGGAASKGVSMAARIRWAVAGEASTAKKLRKAKIHRIVEPHLVR